VCQVLGTSGIPSYSSSATFTYAQLSSKLGITLTANSDIHVINKTTGDRVNTAIFGTKTLTGVKVRSLLGLRSADFDITKTATGVTFSCRGYGHGVGMSQYGANGMAKAGYTYKQILQHYYTGISFGTK
jgi:stage II sporulation protein D